jgi:hypothetical protein
MGIIVFGLSRWRSSMRGLLAGGIFSSLGLVHKLDKPRMRILLFDNLVSETSNFFVSQDCYLVRWQMAGAAEFVAFT